MADERLDYVAVATEVVLPDVIEDLCLGHHPPRVEHQEAQQPELSRGQRDLPRAARNFQAVLVEHQIGVPKHAWRRLSPPKAVATDHRPNPRYQLIETERLGQVVITADRQTRNLVFGRVPGG